MRAPLVPMPRQAVARRDRSNGLPPRPRENRRSNWRKDPRKPKPPKPNDRYRVQPPPARRRTHRHRDGLARTPHDLRRRNRSDAVSPCSRVSFQPGRSELERTKVSSTRSQRASSPAEERVRWQPSAPAGDGSSDEHACRLRALGGTTISLQRVPQSRRCSRSCGATRASATRSISGSLAKRTG